MWKASTNKGKVVHRSRRSKRDRVSHTFRIGDLNRVFRVVTQGFDPTLIFENPKNLRHWVEIELRFFQTQDMLLRYIRQSDIRKGFRTMLNVMRAEVETTLEEGQDASSEKES